MSADLRDRTSEELIRLVAAEGGEGAKAFECLYRRHFEGFIRFSQHNLEAPEADAEDLVQSLFLEIRSKAARFAEAEKFVSYCLTALKYRNVDRLRMALPGEEPGEDCARAPGAGPVTRVMRRETDEELHRALGELPEADREILLRRVVHGLPPGEVAAALGIAKRTVQRRLNEVTDGLQVRLREA